MITHLYTTDKNNMEEQHYKKVGRKYVPVPQAPTLYSPGIWLVSDENSGRSFQLILKIGEIPNLYPYAAMCAADLNKLSRFLSLTEIKAFILSIQDWKDGVMYTLTGNSKMATEVFKFLSATQDEKDEMITQLTNEVVVYSHEKGMNWDGVKLTVKKKVKKK